ncbi:MAG: FHA domain-containing protein [Anaerolineae bacterium]|nr:FHA domain-containing protein [Promineifilum sp.]MCZ2113273.1 FHA domain-containing protein [Anaerolineae bacterium]HNS39212.1 FHA domain-containing protein [Promineifilum sp.]
MIVCLECRSQHYPGTLFCDMCGAAVHPSARAYLEASQAAAGHKSPIRAGSKRHTEPQPAPPYTPDQTIATPFAQPPALRVRVVQHEAELVLRGTQFNIGRTDPFSDFVPEFDVTRFDGQAHGVSRQHATIRWREEGYVLCDNHSSNGTWLNGELLEPGREYPLSAPGNVRFGGLLVQFTIAD